MSGLYTAIMEIKFKAKLWEWEGKGAWCFVTLPPEYSDEIKMITSMPRRGFGSVRIEATIGRAVWKTSIFPGTKTKSYLLPIRKNVRESENLKVGNNITVSVQLLEV